MKRTADRFWRSRRFLLLLLVAAVALRLFLAADRDILAVNAPYDEYWFVHSAARMIWGGNYNHLAFAHLPIYSGWLAFLYLFGLPARLAIDVVWLASAFYLGFSLRHLTGRSWVGAAVFLLLAFHPYSFVLFDRALAETFLAVLSAFVLGGFIEAWNCRDSGNGVRRRLAFLACSVGFAFAYHTRKEGIVILVPVLALAGWSLLKHKQWWSRDGRQILAYPLVVAPLVATVVTGLLLAAVNFQIWGVFARYELAATGYQRAINALNAVDAGKTPKHVTVTAAARSLAYAQSPTFNELREFLEGSPGQMVAGHSAQFTGVPGEIGNGWFYWSLRDAAATAGWHRRAPQAEAKYHAMADELESAFAEGRLPKRRVVISFVDPDWGKWLSDVPRSLFGEMLLVVAPSAAHLDSVPREDASPLQFDEFVRVLGRRQLPMQAYLAGWAIVPEGTRVGLGTNERTLSWQVLAGQQRPDVSGAYPFQLVSSLAERPTELHVLLENGTKGVVAWTDLKEGEVSSISGIPGAHAGVDQKSDGDQVSRLETWMSHLTGRKVGIDWMGPLVKLWSALGYGFLAIGLTALPVSLLRANRETAAVVGVMLLTALAIVTRAGLLAILDASSWNGMQARYLFPAVPLFWTFGVLGLYQIIYKCHWRSM